MKRHRIHPRPAWQEKVEQTGLAWHSHETGPYWDESACYALTPEEVTTLENAGKTLHQLCIHAAEAVIEKNLWARLSIPEKAVPTLIGSWERDDFSLYGRFDLCYDGSAPPKLLEYNADTPTALVEAAVTQWHWLLEIHPHSDQFNSIHERLVAAWHRMAAPMVHFSSIKEHPEDELTTLYLRDTCEQAGTPTKPLYIEDAGWDDQRKNFVDLDMEPIRHWFKLYPWEWLWAEEFGAHLAEDSCRMIEPPWKMLLSNKGLLPILWELFPEHPNLLPAYDQPFPLCGRHVRKPRLGREGSNVQWIEDGRIIEETPGDYGDEGYVYQAPAALPSFDGNTPVFGLWVVDHEPAGLGIREDTRRVTSNQSRFVPHFFNPAESL